MDCGDGEETRRTARFREVGGLAVEGRIWRTFMAWFL
jgi:hypothetical protein